MVRKLLFPTLFVALLLSANAWACPVCGQAKSKEVEWAYIAMTLVLSLSPLLMGGGVIWYFVRKGRQAEREHVLPPGPDSRPSQAVP
jgi:hypothetical protein